MVTVCGLVTERRPASEGSGWALKTWRWQQGATAVTMRREKESIECVRWLHHLQTVLYMLTCLIRKHVSYRSMINHGLEKQIVEGFFFLDTKGYPVVETWYSSNSTARDYRSTFFWPVAVDELLAYFILASIYFSIIYRAVCRAAFRWSDPGGFYCQSWGNINLAESTNFCVVYYCSFKPSWLKDIVENTVQI